MVGQGDGLVAGAQLAQASRTVRPGLVHHWDRGVQYACGEYIDLLEAHQISPRMSRLGNPYDNAKCESFMRTLKKKEIDGREWNRVEELEQTMALFIEDYYNRERLHSALAYLSPSEFEQQAAGTMVLPAAFFSKQRDIYPEGQETPAPGAS